LYHRSNFRHKTNFARKALYVYLIKGHYTSVLDFNITFAGHLAIGVRSNDNVVGSKFLVTAPNAFDKILLIHKGIFWLYILRISVLRFMQGNLARFH
jgi:hypothetical protein